MEVVVKIDINIYDWVEVVSWFFFLFDVMFGLVVCCIGMMDDDYVVVE